MLVPSATRKIKPEISRGILNGTSTRGGRPRCGFDPGLNICNSRGILTQNPNEAPMPMVCEDCEFLRNSPR